MRIEEKGKGKSSSSTNYGLEENYLNIIKVIYEKYTGNIIMVKD